MFRPLALVLGLFLLTTTACDDEDIRAHEEIVTGGTVPETWDGTVTRILEDNIHAIKQNSSLVFDETTFAYSKTYGYTRLFDHLNASGYTHDRITGGALTADLLSRYDILFINLVSDTRPEFSEEEITAILDFVYAGGGLFVVADHTNVYEHAQRVNPFLNPMGINVRYESAVDVGEHAMVGKVWIRIDDMADHPVTADVTEISFLTGGTLDGPGGVAFISEEGWGDFWNPDNEEKPVGKYGNILYDEGEDMGPLSVSQAVEYGAGRVFVVADQNTLGNPYLHFLDNGTLAFNAVEWLARRENDDPPVRLRREAGFHLRIDSLSNDCSVSKSYSPDHFTFYFNLSRNREMVPYATRGPLPATPDAFMVLDPKVDVAPQDLNEAHRVLDEGGQVILIVDATAFTSHAATFLGEFIPDAGLEDADGNPFVPGLEDVPPFVENGSVALPLRGGTRLLPQCPALTCPGHTLLSATSDQGTCDLLCAYPAGNGRFLLALTGAYFRQAAMGSVHEEPEGLQRAYYELQMELVEQLLAW